MTNNFYHNHKSISENDTSSLTELSVEHSNESGNIYQEQVKLLSAELVEGDKPNYVVLYSIWLPHKGISRPPFSWAGKQINENTAAPIPSAADFLCPSQLKTGAGGRKEYCFHLMNAASVLDSQKKREDT